MRRPQLPALHKDWYALSGCDSRHPGSLWPLGRDPCADVTVAVGPSMSSLHVNSLLFVLSPTPSQQAAYESDQIGRLLVQRFTRQCYGPLAGIVETNSI